MLKGLFIRVLAGFRESSTELEALRSISTPRIEEVGEGTILVFKAIWRGLPDRICLFWERYVARPRDSARRKLGE